MREVVSVFGLVVLLAASAVTQAIEPADLGLTRINETRTSVAYLKADQDFSRYDKIAIADIDTSDVKVSPLGGRKAHPVNWEMDEERQARVHEMHRTAFDSEFAKVQNLEVVDSVDESTLILFTRLYEVTPSADSAPRDRLGHSRVFSAYTGSATIEILLVDGKTREVVGAVVSAKPIENHPAHAKGTVMNASSVQEAFNTWASQAREAVENLPELAAEAR